MTSDSKFVYNNNNKYQTLLSKGNVQFIRINFAKKNCKIFNKNSVKLTYIFILVCLRLQVNPENKNEFQGISPERGFADFIFAHVVLHLVVMNFIG